MLRTPGIRRLMFCAVIVLLIGSVRAIAQDDPNEVPLGDVARNLRKNSQPPKQVIDDDNLTQVMEQGENRQELGASLKYVMSGESKLFQVSAPDVTCSLAFTANAKSLLSSTQYSQMDLPASDVGKLEGPATIEGDALTVSLFNATNWHLSEITVALTVVSRKGIGDPGTAGLTDSPSSALQELRPEKKPDMTVMYKMRAAAPPWMRAVFSAPLNVDLQPGDEWHWAIVQAKGYPAESSANAAANTQSPPQSAAPPTTATVQPTSVTSNSATPAVSQAPQ